MSKEEYKYLILKYGGSFLQSWEWGEVQISLEKTVIRILEPGYAGSFILNKFLNNKFYLYAPRGPCFTTSEISWAEVFRSLSKQNNEIQNLVFLRFEPTGIPLEIEGRDFSLYKTEDIQPKNSLLLDLGKSRDDILYGMEHDTRYSIRVAERRGVTIQRFKNLEDRKNKFEDFWTIFRKTNNFHNLGFYNKEYYRKVSTLYGDLRSELVFGCVGGGLISTALILYFGNTATYLFAGSLRGYEHYNAPTLTLWDCICDAKNQGYEFFDFWGISNSNPRWRGLTAFKKSFGGREVPYPGTFDLVFNKKWYFLYRTGKLLHNFFR